MKFTRTTLEKIENIFKENGYTVRYAKGNFQSGYAFVENKKIVVINKFFDTEGRVNTLLDILSFIELDVTLLSEKSAEFHKKIQKLGVQAAA